MYYGNWCIFKLKKSVKEEIVITKKNIKFKFYKRFLKGMVKQSVNNENFDDNFDIFIDSNNEIEINDKLYKKIIKIKKMLRENLKDGYLIFIIKDNELHIGITGGINILDLTYALICKEESSITSEINSNLSLFNLFIKETSELVDIISTQ